MWAITRPFDLHPTSRQLAPPPKPRPPTTTNTVPRFFARPSGVALSAIGMVSRSLRSMSVLVLIRHCKDCSSRRLHGADRTNSCRSHRRSVGPHSCIVRSSSRMSVHVRYPPCACARGRGGRADAVENDLRLFVHLTAPMEERFTEGGTPWGNRANFARSVIGISSLS